MYFDPLSVTLTTNIFSHSVGFLFVLLMGSTVVQKLLSLIRSHLFLCVCQVALSCPTLCNAMGCAAHQAPLSMGFPRQDTGLGCHFLLQGIFTTQGFNPHPLHGQADSLPVRPLGSLQRKCLICTHTQKHMHIYMMEYLFIPEVYLLFIPKKEGNPAVCNNMNKSGGYYNQ